MSLLPDGLRDRLADAMARTDPAILRTLSAALASIYAPRCALNCWEWVERNIVLLPEESRDNHGPYDSSLTPYVRRLMEFVTRPHEHEFIIRKSSQLGFTLAYLLITCYVAATRPTHTLYAMDSAREARNISTRLKRLLTTNAALDTTFIGDGEEDLQNLILKLRGMVVWLVGSGAAGSFANKSAGLVILDELDLHVTPPTGGNTIDRARERLKKVQDGKLIAGGKPEGWDDETNQNYLTGSREQLYLPCPHCGHYQPLLWERIRFEHCKDLAGAWDLPRVIDQTYYACENDLCPRGKIYDHHKAAMLRRYECRATNLGQDDHKPFPGRVSLWVNDLYLATDPQNSWGHMAARFIDAQASPSKLITFFNGALALPQKEKQTEVSKSQLHKLNGGYEHGCMPKAPAINPLTGAAAIFLCADVQATEKKWSKVGLTPAGEMFVIDYGACLGYNDLLVEADVPVWIGHEAPPPDELDALREQCLAAGTDYYTALRAAYPDRDFHIASTGWIDEGHETFVVRDFCQSTADPLRGLPPRFFPSKGVDRVHAIEIVAEITNKFRTAKTDEAPFITVYHYSDAALKRELYLGRIVGFDTVKASAQPQPRLWFPAHTEESYLAELTQETYKQVRHKGRLRWMWEDPKGPNDYGDTLKMALGLWIKVREHFAPAQVATAPTTSTTTTAAA
jgi:phage terminase large subunit GpA-like protein